VSRLTAGLARAPDPVPREAPLYPHPRQAAVIVPSVEDIQAAHQAATRATLPMPVPASAPRPPAATGGDGSSGTPPLPGALLPPGLPRPAPRGAIAIARRRGLAPARRAPRSGEEDEGEEAEDEQEVYSRSLAWMPKSPALPAPFR
jgi:hypothetical protein